jgi:hypothetical protein
MAHGPRNRRLSSCVRARRRAPRLEGAGVPRALCENLPEVRPELKTWVAQVAPELAQVQVRELPEKTALDMFGRAAVAGWGSVDVLTNSVFREPCTFYFSREALRAVDAAFVLDLVTVIRGQDKKGHDFEMTALLAGRGKLVVLYDRDGIIYSNERLARDFKLASRVEFETPGCRCTRKCPRALRQSSSVGLRARPIPREGRRDARGSCRDLHLRDAAEADPSPGPGDARRTGSAAGALQDLALVINAGRQVQRGFFQ